MQTSMNNHLCLELYFISITMTYKTSGLIFVIAFKSCSIVVYRNYLYTTDNAKDLS